MVTLPKSIVAIDVETTGLHSNDRIVSLGAWRLDSDDLGADVLNLQYLYVVADPGKKSHPRAEELHGYSDWTLRHQQPFAEQAQTVREFLSNCEIVIAHNASFDVELISREYHLLGQQAPELHRYCTMNAYRESGLPGRASLNAMSRNGTKPKRKETWRSGRRVAGANDLPLASTLPQNISNLSQE